MAPIVPPPVPPPIPIIPPPVPVVPIVVPVRPADTELNWITPMIGMLAAIQVPIVHRFWVIPTQVNRSAGGLIVLKTAEVKTGNDVITAHERVRVSIEELHRVCIAHQEAMFELDDYRHKLSAQLVRKLNDVSDGNADRATKQARHAARNVAT